MFWGGRSDKKKTSNVADGDSSIMTCLFEEIFYFCPEGGVCFQHTLREVNRKAYELARKALAGNNL